MDNTNQVEPTFWQPEEEWIRVVGQRIEIHEKGQIIDAGQVEDVTGDGTVLWLKMEGATHRRLVEKYPGRHVKILPDARPHDR